jgi:hypothetical protein
MKKIEDMIKIMQAGGQIDLVTGDKATPDLVILAGAAAKWKAELVINGGNKKVDDLIEIVKAGKGRVTVRF